eukprot:PhF_6_TR40353/c0_g1_i1/m.60038
MSLTFPRTAWNEYQWKNLYEKKFGDPVYFMGTWKRTYKLRDSSQYFNLSMFLLDFKKFPNFSPLLCLLEFILSEKDTHACRLVFQDMLVFMEKNTSVALGFCVRCLHSHFDSLKPINDIGDDFTDTESLAHITITSYFSVHCLRWFIENFQTFCLDILCNNEVIMYASSTASSASRVENMMHVYTKFVNVLLQCTPLPPAMQILLNIHQQKVNVRIRSYLESITVKGNHVLQKNMQSCAATLDVLLNKTIMNILADADMYGLPLPSSKILHFRRNFGVLQMLLEKSILGVDMKDTDLFNEFTAFGRDDDTKSVASTIKSLEQPTADPSRKSSSDRHSTSNPPSVPTSDDESDESLSNLRKAVGGKSGINTTQLLMRVNACMMRLASSLQRFGRQVSGDAASGVIEAVEYVIDEDTEAAVLKALWVSYQDMVNKWQEPEYVDKYGCEFVNMLIKVVNDGQHESTPDWSERRKGLLVDPDKPKKEGEEDTDDANNV